MKRLMFVSMLVLWAAVPAQAEHLKAGAAVVDVTPPTGFPMWGYGARRDAPSDGVMDPLMAKALVISSGGESMALIGLDIGRAPMRNSMATIRAKVKEAVGVEHLFIVGSHTHHGPVIELDNWPTPETSYVRDLEKKLAQVIIDAAKNMKPARLGVESKEVGLNRNRHSRRPDKMVDRELLVLRVEDMDGKVIAHAVNFAAHPTMIPAQVMKFSADFCGHMMNAVEKETGAPCLFLQGAAGDLSANPPQGSRGPEQFGKALAKEVLNLISRVKVEEFEDSDLKIREDNFKFNNRIDLSNTVIRGMLVRAFFEDLIKAFEEEYKDGVRPTMTTALLDKRIAFVGGSGEFFCGHSLSLKRRSRLKHVFFLGYCNDYQQYFPTLETASEGGYGTQPGVANVELGAGEQMMNKALFHLYDMRGRYPGAPTRE